MKIGTELLLTMSITPTTPSSHVASKGEECHD
jgi:hypothetical protein